MKDIIYIRFGRKYRKLARDEKIPEGSMQSWCNSELQPIMNDQTIGAKPSEFSNERDFYAPILT